MFLSSSLTQLLAMQSKVRRLRSVCEKTTKREWKEGKGQLNKRMLSKIQVRLTCFTGYAKVQDYLDSRKQTSYSLRAALRVVTNFSSRREK